MKGYYSDDKYNQAFERWINLMVDLIVKHGPAVLKKLDHKMIPVTDYIVWPDADFRKRQSDRMYFLLECCKAA